MMYFDKITIPKTLIQILFIWSISCSYTSNSHAQNWHEVVKSLASDKQAGDEFGSSVSISGYYAIVGAIGEDIGGSSAGAAYIFHKDKDGTNNWGEVQKIQASDKQASDQFGSSVSISGDYAIVGAVGEDTGGNNAGAAYIFHKDKDGTNNWGEVKKIQASDKEEFDFFGSSVSISGDYAIVGARGEDTGGSNVGAAYIFHKDQGGIGNWGEVKKIQASDKAVEGFLGSSVSISGDYAIVGAVDEGTGGSNVGAAYIFHKDKDGTNNWGEVKKIQASDKQAFDRFGSSVSISGDYAIVGAVDEGTGGNRAGAAYLFHKDKDGTNNWGEVQKIQANDKEAFDFFGSSVSISGDYAMVGVVGEDTGGNNAGAAYIFHKDKDGTNNWGEVQKIQASDKEEFDFFGSSVSISGGYAIVGADFEDTGGSFAGASYIFQSCDVYSSIISGNLEYCASNLTTTLDAGTWTSYLWSNGETSQIIAVSEGTYTVTITDSNGCTGTDQVIVTKNGNPSPSITGNLEYCTSFSSTTLDAGIWKTYQWSNGETSQIIAVSEGTYTVTITDSNGCTGTDQVIVTKNGNPSPSITGNLEYCASSNSTTLDAGIWKTYQWSNRETSQVIETSEGTYAVTVSNSEGCTGKDEVTVVSNANPIPSITGDLAYCRGRQATLNAGIWEIYSWSNGEIAQSFSTTSIGIYTVTITDSNGCTGTATAEVKQTPCLAEAGTLTTNATTICAGGNIEVSTTNEQTATNYFQYFFLYTQDNLGITSLHESMIADYGTGKAAATFEGLEAGNYLVCTYNECQDCLPNPSPITSNLDDIYETGTIQDGCFDIECITLKVPETFASNIENSGQVTGTNASGHSIFIGEICGGTAPYDYDYDFSNGFISVQEYPSSNSGCISYQVIYTQGTEWELTITDAHNCSNETVVFSSTGLPDMPLPQIVYFSTSPETCVGDFDGSITLEVEGGDATCSEYTYTWSGPNGFSETTTDETTGSTLEDIAAGMYAVLVTDCAGTTTTLTGINITRSNIGGRGGRGRGGCKTGGELEEHLLLFASPNPFSEHIMIEFNLPEASNVWLTIYSTDGRKVAQLLEGEMMKEEMLQRYDFEANDLESGLYLLQLRTDTGLRQHQQLVVVK